MLIIDSTRANEISGTIAALKASRNLIIVAHLLRSLSYDVRMGSTVNTTTTFGVLNKPLLEEADRTFLSKTEDKTVEIVSRVLGDKVIKDYNAAPSTPLTAKTLPFATRESEQVLHRLREIFAKEMNDQ